jgi:hypothetical protein
VRVRLAQFLIGAFLALMSLQVFSHSTKEAHFKIYADGAFILVEADFSWSIKNAIVKEFPSLENSTTKMEVLNGLQEYLGVHLVLTDKKGIRLNLIELAEITKKLEGHENRFILKYELGDLSRIKNTSQFNVSDNQLNYHNLIWDGKEHQFVTSIDQEDYGLPKQISKGLIWLLSILLVCAIALVFYLKRKKAGSY